MCKPGFNRDLITDIDQTLVQKNFNRNFNINSERKLSIPTHEPTVKQAHNLLEE